LLTGIERSEFMHVVAPTGALYAFPSIDTHKIPHFNDAKFAAELLENEHVLVVPGSGFNISRTNHVRLTFLPSEDTMSEVFVRMERVLSRMAETRSV
jgi:alanine-synthesizing transaminase